MIGYFYNQTLTVRRNIENNLGRIVDTSSVTIPCRKEETTVKVTGSEGEYYRKQDYYYVPPESDVQVNDIITVNEITGEPAAEFKIKNVKKARGFGLHHLEIEV